MALLNDDVKKKAAKVLEGITGPVKLVVFTQEMECPTCRENRSLAEEVGTLSDKLSVEVYNLQIDRDKAEEYRVDRVPTICVVGDKDHGIRLHGIPSGYEFTSLLAAIDMVGKGESKLKPATKEKLAGLEKDIDIQVFVTLTCPYCPMMVTLAHRFAYESDKVTAAVVDAGEFPQLANLHQVMAVPKTVINRTVSFEGAAPEEKLLEHVLEAAAGDEEPGEEEKKD